MKRTPFRLLAAAMALAVTLTACGGSGSDGGKQAITLWMYPVITDPQESQAFWRKVEQDFDTAHPDIDLTVQLQTFDKRDAQLGAALAAGKGPDIVLVTPDMASTYQRIKGLEPVGDGLKRDDFLPGPLKAATIDGELYGVPLFQNVSTTAYNTKIFADAGLPLPTTWAQLAAAAPVLAKKKIAVTDYAGSPEQTLNLTFYPLLWQAGGRVFTEDGSDVAFDSAEGVAALQFLVDLNAAGGLPRDAATSGPGVEGQPVAQGKVAVRMTSSLNDLKQLRRALGAKNVAFGPPLTGKVQATYGNPGLLALTSITKSDGKDAANEALRYLTSAEVQSALIAKTGALPTRTDVKVDTADPDVAQLVKALQVANPGEASPASRQVMAVLAPKIQAALRGDLSPQDALGQAAVEARSVLKNS
ncbi:extracellular solute-binding protein [Kribbella endophytica]